MTTVSILLSYGAFFFNLFALDCNVLHLNVILVHVFALLTLLHHFLGGTCKLITVYGVFVMSKIDSKYG